jgi:hypothetical protein
MLRVDTLVCYTGHSKGWSLNIRGKFVNNALVIHKLSFDGVDVGNYQSDMCRGRVIILLRVCQVNALQKAFVLAHLSLAASDKLACELR